MAEYPEQYDGQPGEMGFYAERYACYDGMNGQQDQEHVRINAMLFIIFGMPGDVMIPVYDAIDQQQPDETERGQQRSQRVIGDPFELLNAFRQ